jgi:hypothetical protein
MFMGNQPRKSQNAWMGRGGEERGGMGFEQEVTEGTEEMGRRENGKLKAES